MIIGFGNNTASALASDITAAQTYFSVVPGAGESFAKLLTAEISNPSSPHGIYAKLTLTDSQQTVFEICHLTAVSNDTLTVIRGQEGTTAKGWSLNDVVANFATRGSEQSFVQVEQLQGGDYSSATAGGAPNALSISLPSTFSNNNTADWLIKIPLLVTPIATNTAGVTLQITLGGKVIGTFPLYKGNKAQLDSGDIIAGVPICCILDQSKAFFNVINPVAAYIGYTPSNPPPYPVTSVNGMTGVVNIDVGYTPSNPPPYPVTSVNGMIGVVNIDVGYTPSNPPPYPVTSVNGMNGAVNIDVGYTPSNPPPSGQTTTGNTSAYYTHSNGQIFLQCIGGVASNSSSNPDVTVYLPAAFPNGILGIGGSFSGSGGDDSDSWWTATVASSSSFNLHTRNCSGAWCFVVAGY
ncbi:hypothetical protein [Buttiauxella sp. S19-1]|uniref:hypothetical protein n=1 Tax=Buttiauxella sp. S19-1 TaxID=941430 RepID=UPI001EDC5FAA|nr:hypothetical protein [Buttiauxella sp. S19-1]